MENLNELVGLVYQPTKVVVPKFVCLNHLIVRIRPFYEWFDAEVTYVYIDNGRETRSIPMPKTMDSHRPDKFLDGMDTFQSFDMLKMHILNFKRCEY